MVVGAGERDAAAIGAERAVGAAEREDRRTSCGGVGIGVGCGATGWAMPSAPNWLSPQPKSAPSLVRISVPWPPAATCVTRTPAGSVTFAGVARLGGRAVAQLRLRVVAPRPDAAVGARGDAVPRARGERDDVGHLGDQREAVDRLAVAELPVASAPERIELLVLRENQRVKGAGTHLGDVARQLRNRHLGEHLGAPAPATGHWPIALSPLQ